MCDGDIFKGDVKFLGSFEEFGSDAVADGFTLCNKLGGIELGYNSLKDFITNRWKNTFIIILSETLYI